MAGVLGNLTDRVFRAPGVFRGHVVDFLQLPNWPIFNVADMCINIAAGVIILQAIRGVSVNGTRSRDGRRPRAGTRDGARTSAVTSGARSRSPTGWPASASTPPSPGCSACPAPGRPS